jgi:hypothetical protein
MYNIVARSRNRISVETQQFSLCLLLLSHMSPSNMSVAVESYVSVKYVQILRLRGAFMVNLH